MWVTRTHIDENDPPEVVEKKRILNECLLNRRPYFFKYRYHEDKKAYDAYYATKNCVCLSTFKMSVAELRALPEKTQEQEQWLRDYDDFCPLVDSNSSMNLLCKYMESVSFDVKSKAKNHGSFNSVEYMSDDTEWEDIYNDVAIVYQNYLRDVKNSESRSATNDERKSIRERLLVGLQTQLGCIHSDPRVITDALVWFVYVAHPSARKETVWSLYGRYMAQNASKHEKNRGGKLYIPVEVDKEQAETEYLGRYYAMREVDE